MATCSYCQRTRAAMLDHFKAWYSHPFRSDMSAGGWFAFVFLLVICIAGNAIILRHIKGA